MSAETNTGKTSKKKSINWEGVGDWALKIGFFAVQAAVGGMAGAAGAHAFNRVANGGWESNVNYGADRTVVPMRKTTAV